MTEKNDFRIRSMIMRLQAMESVLADMVSDEMTKREEEGCDPTPMTVSDNNPGFVVAEEAAQELDQARTHLQECIDALDRYLDEGAYRNG